MHRSVHLIHIYLYSAGKVPVVKHSQKKHFLLGLLLLLTSASHGLMHLLIFVLLLSALWRKCPHLGCVLYVVSCHFFLHIFSGQLECIHRLISHQINTFELLSLLDFPPSTIIEQEGGARRKVNIKFLSKNTTEMFTRVIAMYKGNPPQQSRCKC